MEVNSAIFILLGSWAAIFFLLPRFVGKLFEEVFSSNSTSGSNFKRGLFRSFIYKIHLNLYTTTGIAMPALILAAIFGCLGSFVLVWAVITTSAMLVLMIQLLREARAQHAYKSN